MNREEQSIVYAYENGTISQIAKERARRNEQGFTYNWTSEQHETALIQKAKSLIAEQTPVQQTKPQPSPRTYNTGFGYYGTAKDAAKGFDGIE